MINWAHWHSEPYLIGGLVALGWVYALVIGPLRRRLLPRYPTPAPGATACFFASLLVFYIAVGSPLDQVAEQYLFSAHMAQHLLLIYPAAILFLRGLPAPIIDWLLEAGWLRHPLRHLTRPWVAVPLYLAVTGVWHMPYFYDWALRDRVVHVLEHLMFFAVAILLWWPCFNCSSRLPRIPYGAQLLYQFALMAGNTPLFAYIVYSSEVIYPTYEFAPRLTGLSALEDQVLAGAMMKIVGVLVALVFMALAFYRWYDDSERAARLAAEPVRDRPPVVRKVVTLPLVR